MAKNLHDAQWLALPTFLLGILILLNVAAFLPDALAVVKVLIALSFLLASYGLWTARKWGGTLAVAMCIVKLFETFLRISTGDYSYFIAINFIVYITIPAMLYFNVWKMLK